MQRPNTDNPMTEAPFPETAQNLQPRSPGTGLSWLGILLAAIALLAIFLPGFLLLLGVLPFWNRVSHWPAARAILRGANAAVVGVLAAALYDPVFTSAITSAPAFVLALLCFVLLTVWKTAPWIVVAISGLGGVLLGLLA